MSAAPIDELETTVLVRPIENSYVVPGTTLVAGEYPGAPPTKPKAELEIRLVSFLDRGITAFIDLTAAKDALAPYEPTLQALAKKRDINVEYESFPIVDMDVCDDETMCAVLDAIDDHLAAGQSVYVHCWGGVGRTGTVVGCWLKRHGKMGAEALSDVARLFATMSLDKVTRHKYWGSPQTAKQREMVEEWPEGVMYRMTSAKATEKRRRRKERMGEIAPPSREARVGAQEIAHAVRSVDAADEVDEDDEEEADPPGRGGAYGARGGGAFGTRS